MALGAHTGGRPLPDVITAGGPTGSSTAIPVITYDAKGRLTAVSTATPQSSAFALPFGNNGNQTYASSTFYHPLGQAAFDPANTTEAESKAPCPRSGTLTRLAVQIKTLPAAGQSVVFTVRINGVDTALTVTFSDADTVNVAKASTGSVAVTQDDDVTVSVTGGATARTYRPLGYVQLNPS